MVVATVDNFRAYIAAVLVLEGGGVYIDNPVDRGGPTIFGITAAAATAAGYTGPLVAMTHDQAVAIYRQVFWHAPGFDLVDPILPALAAYLLNIGINQGPPSPVRMLQRALNALGNNGGSYRHLLVDGQCGPVTRGVLSDYLTHRPSSANGAAVLLGTLRALVAVNYIEIVETDTDQAAFAYGWLRDRALSLPESASQPL